MYVTETHRYDIPGYDTRLSVPVKFWTDPYSLEKQALDQIYSLAELPFAYKHIAIMPDAHTGYGVPIGGVLATEGAILPNAVGVDMGCGMEFVALTVDGVERSADVLQQETDQGTLGKTILSKVQRDVKVGVGNNYGQCQYTTEKEELFDYSFDVLDDDALEMPTTLLNELFDDKAALALGTLGGGNHFIELQEDVENGDIGLMIHTGSRAFGYGIARHYYEHAKTMNEKWHSDVPNIDLAFLPARSKIGQEYYRFTKIASKFAEINRRIIMDAFIDATRIALEHEGMNDYSFNERVKCHHNFVDIEHHYGKNVYIHRKGAIRAREGDVGIIPGAMGSYSYIVEGKGNKESFTSASHGAGRAMSRNQAKTEFTTQDMMEDFKAKGMFLITRNKDSARDEYHRAYKDINEVIGNEKDLVAVRRKLRTVGVLKG